MKLHPIKKYLLVFLGSLSLFLGVAGIFIPILPTTPFLLVASICYLKSSKRMYDWLLNHNILGAYIYSYLTYKTVSKKIKLGTMIFLWVTLSITMIIVSSLHIRILLVAVGVSVTVHIITLKTLGKEEPRALNDLYNKRPKDKTAANEE